MVFFVDSVVLTETVVVLMKAGPVWDFATSNQGYKLGEPGAGD